jgi:hypothetical protein
MPVLLHLDFFLISSRAATIVNPRTSARKPTWPAGGRLHGDGSKAALYYKL